MFYLLSLLDTLQEKHSFRYVRYENSIFVYVKTKLIVFVPEIMSATIFKDTSWKEPIKASYHQGFTELIKS